MSVKDKTKRFPTLNHLTYLLNNLFVCLFFVC